jgi:hypothetical protein
MLSTAGHPQGPHVQLNLAVDVVEDHLTRGCRIPRSIAGKYYARVITQRLRPGRVNFTLKIPSCVHAVVSVAPIV